MDGAMVSDAFRQMLDASIAVAGPYLLIGLAVGLIMSLFQALTQLQESSLVFVPKLLAVIILMGILGPWSVDSLVRYTVSMFELFGTSLAP